MVEIELIRTGERIEIYDADLTYKKQVADLANVTTINSSYSPTFTMPKTPNNTKILENLGIVGDQSTMPYRKIFCRLLENNTVIIHKGLLNIKETTEEDEYEAHIQEGVVEFFKDIENDKMGEELDLSELDHRNDYDTIIDSFSNDKPYRYILADFNGPPRPNLNGVTDLNPSAIVPSVNCKWLWDSIFQHYGWSYSGDFDFDQMEDLWMSYPSALTFEDATAIQRAKLGYRGKGERMVWNDTVIQLGYAEEPDLEFGELVNGGLEFEIKKSGIYKIEFGVWGYRYYYESSWVFWKKRREVEAVTILEIGGDRHRFGDSHGSYDQEFISGEFELEAGTKLRLLTGGRPERLHIDSVMLNIYEAGVQDVDFHKAFLDFKVREYFKEMMIRFSLTAFPDTVNKTIHFSTLEQRLEADFIDWSSKYVKRKGETYTYRDYARNNYLKHKYDKEEQDYNDGNLQVRNENLDTEKTLYQSKTYSPEQDMVTWNGTVDANYNVPSIKLYDLEIKQVEVENADGTTTTELRGDYKPLKQRFYIFRAEWREETVNILSQPTFGFPLATFLGCNFNDIVGNRYSKIGALLSDTKVHNIELALSQYDVATLDLEKQYYFEQEKSYYILNTLTWKRGGICTGEFIRVKR